MGGGGIFASLQGKLGGQPDGRNDVEDIADVRWGGYDAGNRLQMVEKSGDSDNCHPIDMRVEIAAVYPGIFMQGLDCQSGSSRRATHALGELAVPRPLRLPGAQASVNPPWVIH